MILLRNFNREFTIIRLQQFGNPKIAPFSKLSLPVGSTLHYVPTSGISEIGPPQTLPVLERAEKLVQVNHITQLTDNNVLGRPRRVEAGINRDVQHYHRVNKKLRRLHDTKLVERDPRTLLVYNYAPVMRMYRYQQSEMSWYAQWHNNFATVVEGLSTASSKYDRQNYLLLTIPDMLASINKLRRAEKRRDVSTLKDMKDDASLFILELWTWLGTTRESSLLNQIDSAQMKRINVLLSYNDKFINLNLGELDFWRKGDDGDGQVSPEQMQRRLYKTMTDLATAEPEVVEAVEDEEDDNVLTDLEGREIHQLIDRSDVDNDIDIEVELKDEIEAFDKLDKTEADVDFEIVKKEEIGAATKVETEVTVDEGIEKACTRYIEAGSITTKEYQRIKDLGTNYLKIPNPYGEGTLADMLEVKPEELKVEETVMVDDDSIFDKSMAVSSTINFNRDYITKVLPKDISGSVVSLQRAGVAVVDYNVEEVIDAANRLNLHTVKLAPVKGQQSTIRFTTPMIDEEGYWTANDIRYTMRKQRVDCKSAILCN